MGEPVAAFVAALESANATLAGIGQRLAAAEVSDTAFGRLFEAHAVRDCYRERLPQAGTDLAEARAVLDHFVTGLRGGHPVGPVPVVPRQNPPDAP
jgi:hypothetical protein